jgi:hypothetical protein
MKTKTFTLTIFFILFFTGFTIAQPWTYLFDDYEGTNLLYTTTSNVVVGPALKAVDLPYFNFSGGTPNINLINTGGGWESMNFYGNIDFYTMFHSDGVGLQFVHGTGAFNLNDPTQGPYWDKTMLTLTPDVVTVGGANDGTSFGSTTTKLQVNGDIDFTGKLYRNGVELAAFPDVIWTKDASNNVNYMAGKVGIGTTNPSQALTIDTKQTASNAGIPSTSGTSQNGIMRLQADGNSWGEVMDFGMNVSPSFAWIQPTNRGNLATNYNLSLNPNGGNVGIGITIPQSKLDVAGDINFTGTLLKNGQPFTGTLWTKDASNNINYTAGNVSISDNSKFFGANFETNNYTTMTFLSRAWQTVQGVNGKAYSFQTHSNNGNSGFEMMAIYYGENGKISMVPNGGAVTIGTYTPATDAKLTVKGKIVAGEVLVKNITEIPDYVFKRDHMILLWEKEFK